MEINGKKILITGGCGFIGLNLIDHLQENYDCDIFVLDDESVGSSDELPPGIGFLQGDICDMRRCWGSCLNMDVVVHLAAKTQVVESVASPRADATVNITGSMNMLEVSKLTHIQKYIHASSAGVIGDASTLPIHENSPTNPMSPYGISKLAAEKYTLAYASLYGLNTMALRFSNIYGPRSAHKENVIPKFVKKILKGEALEINGTGIQTRDFLYSEDLSRAIVLAMRYEPQKLFGADRLFHLATGKETSIIDLLEVLNKLSPKEFRVEHKAPLPGEIMRNFSNISKAKAILGWEPVYDLEEGVQKVFEAFEE